MAKMTFGVIVGNRGFFPDVLAKEGRKNILDVLKKNGHRTVALGMNESKYGAVETFEEAKKCAALFASNARKIDGIIVIDMLYGRTVRQILGAIDKWHTGSAAPPASTRSAG